MKLPRRTPTATRSSSSVDGWARRWRAEAEGDQLRPRRGIPGGRAEARAAGTGDTRDARVGGADEGSTPEETLNNVKEAESRGTPVLGAVSGAVADAEKFVDEVFEVPESGDGAAGSEVYF